MYHQKLNQEGAFSNTSVNEKVDIFNRTILNVLSNFIPREIIVCNDKDSTWFNNRIKTLIQEKNASYKIYRHNKDIPDLIYSLQFLQERLGTSIESSSERYYARIANRLDNSKKSSKTSNSALRRRGDVVTTSFCTSQRRRRYVPNETPNYVSMERRQDFSVVHLHDVLLEPRNDLSKDVTTTSHQHVSTKFQTSPK